ncbi:hypothetical protein P153DRAFT_383667 [Dothidotthia symphoricarpi CBS 119687]|uniref:Uncharacterized protein n=1 Tax=Dothidotthia symphoricarpi CBS 119687 TaxID=1392245 RepID=A0A6A6AK11_9PLEO|nr:uncharacterized protein P153DRAFT_383667 [Dothidotthia symphoricarpi CBS 119687]KAF2131573.1 hypothetical protein P153DRAFT_383667 [Dothidotthia symphoricarpi CBS 119687]
MTSKFTEILEPTQAPTYTHPHLNVSLEDILAEEGRKRSASQSSQGSQTGSDSSAPPSPTSSTHDHASKMGLLKRRAFTLGTKKALSRDATPPDPRSQLVSIDLDMLLHVLPFVFGERHRTQEEQFTQQSLPPPSLEPLDGFLSQARIYACLLLAKWCLMREGIACTIWRNLAE